MNEEIYCEIKTFFKENGVSPYDLLGINKNSSKQEIKDAYKRKALELHPDRNKEEDTTVQFQILTMCYEFAKERNKKLRKSASFNELKNEYEQANKEIMKNTNQNTNEDPDRIELSQEEQDFLTRTSAPKNGYGDYGGKLLPRNKELNYNTLDMTIAPPERIMKKFNNTKFNAIFEHIKDSSPDSKQIIQKIADPYYKTKLTMCDVVTDGEIMIVGEEDVKDFTTNHGVDYLKSFGTLFQPSKKIHSEEIDYTRSNVKNNMRKLKDSEIKYQISKKFKPLNIAHEKPFAEMKVDFINNQMDTMRAEQEKNKMYIDKKRHIFKHTPRLNFKD